MDPINGLSQITQILRQKLSERAPCISGKDSGLSESDLNRTGRAHCKVSAEEIKRKIGERIKALSIEERGGRKPAQIFVEAVLVWEFGEQLIQDPQFTELSKEIVNAMADNPKIWRQLQSLLKEFGLESR